MSNTNNPENDSPTIDNPLSNETYLNSGGTNCPCCNSTDIEGGSIEVEGGSAWQPVSCNDCDATWNDVYKLTGYQNLSE